MSVEVIKESCIGCGACIEECPVGALDLIDGIAVVDPDKCTDCGECIDVCPTSALFLEGHKEAGDRETKDEAELVVSKNPNDEYAGVWVIIEHSSGEIADVSWELIGLGRKLADDLEDELAGIFLGHQVKDNANLAFEYGVDKMYVIDDPVLKDFRAEPHAEALAKLIEKHKPEIVLVGATTQGRDLAGRVATRVETGLTADCTELTIERDSRLLLQTRPAFGGNVMATIVCRETRPQMASVRPKVMPMPEKVEGRTGIVIEEILDVKEEDVATKILEVIKENGKGVYLDQADVIVAGGRGLGSQDNFKYIFELAGILGGTPGASRVAVEAGWADAAYQVGQTGTTVRPKVYLAIGISGAVQHVVGMKASDIIVAINSDPEAPIFQIANYGIVGDLQEVLPLLIDAFRQKMQS